jgi:hypothetical protein
VRIEEKCNIELQRRRRRKEEPIFQKRGEQKSPISRMGPYGIVRISRDRSLKRRRIKHSA